MAQSFVEASQDMLASVLKKVESTDTGMMAIEWLLLIELGIIIVEETKVVVKDAGKEDALDSRIMIDDTEKEEILVNSIKPSTVIKENIKDDKAPNKAKEKRDFIPGDLLLVSKSRLRLIQCKSKSKLSGALKFEEGGATTQVVSASESNNKDSGVVLPLKLEWMSEPQHDYSPVMVCEFYTSFAATLIKIPKNGDSAKDQPPLDSVQISGKKLIFQSRPSNVSYLVLGMRYLLT
ncbi:hypothetical protein HAX54_022711 [Datura stramonium]|uniref:Uncharacterized protein n=1 Tax=Datura stramonium TaxID=4076 RepID=A0ABS8UVK0_DATST|nr:hypothetical protein [Datura stramonium]